MKVSELAKVAAVLGRYEEGGPSSDPSIYMEHDCLYLPGPPPYELPPHDREVVEAHCHYEDDYWMAY